MRYEFLESSNLAKRAKNPNAPAVTQDVILVDKGSLLLDIPRERYRLERVEDEYHVQLGMTELSYTKTFDGNLTWWTGGRSKAGKEVKKPKDPDVGTYSGPMQHSPIDMKLAPLFAGHGIVLIQGGDIIPGKWHVGPETALLSVHGVGAFEGRSCLILRTHTVGSGAEASFKEFWIDQGRQSALVRILRYIGNHPTTELNVQYQKTKSGWLTRGWTDSMRNWTPDFKKSTLVHFTKYDVKELNLGPIVEEKDFQLKINAGMLVRKIELKDPITEPIKPTKDLGRYYRFDDNLRPREVVFEDGVERYRSTFHVFWLLISLGALVAIGWYIWWRRKRKRLRPLAEGSVGPEN